MLSALLAIALQSSSTNCYPIGNTVQCDTFRPQQSTPAPVQSQPFSASEALRAFQMGREMAQQGDRQPLVPQYSPAPMDDGTSAVRHIFAQELARRMVVLIDMRRCQDAHMLAVLAGEMDMAMNSRQMCPF